MFTWMSFSVLQPKRYPIAAWPPSGVMPPTLMTGFVVFSTEFPDQPISFLRELEILHQRLADLRLGHAQAGRTEAFDGRRRPGLRHVSGMLHEGLPVSHRQEVTIHQRNPTALPPIEKDVVRQRLELFFVDHSEPAQRQLLTRLE